MAHGHLLFIGETEGDPVIEEKLISDFLDRQVDAFIYASMSTRYVRVPKLLRGRPVVLLNCLTRAAGHLAHDVDRGARERGANSGPGVGAGHSTSPAHDR